MRRLFAASILPLSTAHVICEGLGFEAGIDHKFSEAPIFYWLYTVLIAVGAGIVLLPNAPLWKILIFSQVGNGIWLPVVVIFILLLVNRRDLMGEYVNTLTFNVVAWVTAIAMIVLDAGVCPIRRSSRAASPPSPNGKYCCRYDAIDWHSGVAPRAKACVNFAA